jgi:hypothetical protein
LKKIVFALLHTLFGTEGLNTHKMAEKYKTPIINVS